MSRFLRRRMLIVVGAAAVSLALGGCGDGDGDTAAAVTGVGGAQVPATQVIAAVEGVCQASAETHADPQRARAIFLDEAHDRLHDLAFALEHADRVAAARLLAAKQRVEQALEDPATPSKLRADLDNLVATAAAALDTLGIDPPPCTR
ncbi:MAG: hypothetical protein ACRDJP_05700 [Actinomycetota bacterium]